MAKNSARCRVVYAERFTKPDSWPPAAALEQAKNLRAENAATERNFQRTSTGALRTSPALGSLVQPPPHFFDALSPHP